MALAYSQDLRDRVVDAALVEGAPARPAAARFGVRIATATRWVRPARHSGDRAPGRRGQPRRSKLDPHRHSVRELACATDMTLTELAEKVSVERGVAVDGGVGVPWPHRPHGQKDRARRRAGAFGLLSKRRRNGFDAQPELDPGRLAFIGETWPSTNMGLDQHGAPPRPSAEGGEPRSRTDIGRPPPSRRACA